MQLVCSTSLLDMLGSAHLYQQRSMKGSKRTSSPLGGEHTGYALPNPPKSTCPYAVLATVNLVLVAKTGTDTLAAVALGNNLAIMCSKLVLLGLCGALDTQAAQAVGAGRLGRLPLLYQRSVLWLLLHCVPIAALLLAAPRLACNTSDTADAHMLRLVEQYMWYCLPSVFLEAFSRPLSRILVAQRVTGALMAIALIELPINAAANWLLVLHWDLRHVGAGLSLSFASALDLLLMVRRWAAPGAMG